MYFKWSQLSRPFWCLVTLNVCQCWIIGCIKNRAEVKRNTSLNKSLLVVPSFATLYPVLNQWSSDAGRGNPLHTQLTCKTSCGMAHVVAEEFDRVSYYEEKWKLGMDNDIEYKLMSGIQCVYMASLGIRNAVSTGTIHSQYMLSLNRRIMCTLGVFQWREHLRQHTCTCTLNKQEIWGPVTDQIVVSFR